MKRFAAYIMILCVILVAVLPVSFSVSADELERYGYTLLTSQNQKDAYIAIAEGIGAANEDIKFTISGISPDDVQIAGEMVLRDYPEYFWYDGGATISITGNDVTFAPSNGYNVNGQKVTADSAALSAAKNQLETVISSAMSMLPNNPSEYEIAHTFHDFVVNNVSYESVGDHQTAYGALVSGKAVCAGYARAFQLLMNRAGIRCWYVAGDSFDPNGNQVAHAWNLYWLDGKCYYSDPTWDDQGDELFHEYLNMSLEEISKTHFTEDVLPASCGHDDYTFFVMSDGKGVCDIRDHKNVKDVAKCFEIKSQNGGKTEYYCTIHYHGDDFADWLNQNAAAIVQELGYSSVDGVSVIELGHEHHVTILGKLKEGTKPPAPTEPDPTTKPTEPAPTTKPTEPAPTTKPTDPTPTTTPTEPAPTTKPTEPAPTTKPTEPVSTTTPTGPATTTAPAGSDAATDPSVSAPDTTTVPAVSAKPTTPAKPTQPAPSGNEKENGSTVVIIAVCVAAAAGIGAAVYFLVIKKK